MGIYSAPTRGPEEMYNTATLSLPLCSSSALIPCRKFAPHRQTGALTHYTVKSSITRFSFCFKFNQYKHCSKCYEKKCTLDLLCFYTRQAEAENYIYRLLPFHLHPPSRFSPSRVCRDILILLSSQRVAG